MICRVCKKEIKESKICSFCGEDNTPFTDIPEEIADIAQTDTPEEKSYFKKLYKEGKKYKLNKKKLLRLIIAVALIVILIVVVLGFFKKDEPRATQTADTPLFSSEMLGVRANGEWGYINLEDMSIFAITPQFSHITNYHGNRAAVCIDGKFSLIDKDGSLICEPTFESIGEFSSNGLIAAKTEGKWGYIDESADFIIEPKFTVAQGFAPNNTAVVSVGKSYGFIGKDGEYTIAPQYDMAFSFTGDNLAAVKTGGKWGYIDESGSAVIEPIFDEAYPFENGYAVVKQYGSYGMIDTKGNVKIKPQFDTRFKFNGDYATVKIGKKYGVIKKDGTFVINPSYIALGDFGKDGLAYATRGDGKTGFINTNDKFVISPEFEDAKNFCNGLAPIKENGLWGYVDTDGNIVIEAKFLDASEFYSDGYAYVKNVDNSISVLDTEGNAIMLSSTATVGDVLK